MIARPPGRLCFILDEPEMAADGQPIIPRYADMMAEAAREHLIDIFVPVSSTLPATARQAIAIGLSLSGTFIEFLELPHGVSTGRSKSHLVARHLAAQDAYDSVYFLGAPWLAHDTLAARSRGLILTGSAVVLHPAGADPSDSVPRISAMRAPMSGQAMTQSNPVRERVATESAASRLLDLISTCSPTRPCPYDDASALLRDMLGAPTSPDHARVMAALRSAPFFRHPDQRLQDCMFRLALAVGDRDAALRIEQLAAQADETEYLARYADVASAVAGGRVRSGFKHYIRHGMAENRTGFGRLSQMAELLSIWTARPVALRHLPKVLQGLEQRVAL
ncbi:MAG: hypothetical protein R3E47_02515 [Paracoccaceae bacterium]